MNLEQKMIINLSKYRLDCNDIDTIHSVMTNRPNWDFLISQIIAHRLGGMAYHHINSLELFKLVPKEIRQHLRLIIEYNRLQTLRMDNYLNMLIAQINNSLKYAILKGSALNKTFYPNYGRISNDIDILIHKEDYYYFDELLKKIGFSSDMNNKKNNINLMVSSHQFPCYNIYSDDGICTTIDLQYEFIQSKRMKYNIDVNKVLSRIISINSKIGNIKVLSPYDQLIHVCTHAFGDCTTISEVLNRKAFRLYQFGDIWGIINYYQLNIDDEFINRIINLNMILPVYFCLKYVDLLYGGGDQIKQAIYRIENRGIDTEVLNCCGFEFNKKILWSKPLENKLFDYYSQREIIKDDEIKSTIERIKKFDDRLY